MSKSEQKLHLDEVANTYIDSARKYDHSAIFYNTVRGWDIDTNLRCIERIKEITNNEFFLLMHGDSTYALPEGNEVMDFAVRMLEDAYGLKNEAQKMLEEQIKFMDYAKSWGILDGFGLCADYCFNRNPFMSPEQFREFIFPYQKELIANYRPKGFYVIKHTDGNIMPILDMLVESNPHALHSLDPQGGVDIAEVKRLYEDKLCLIGNVNCASLQTGTLEDLEESVLYALRNGMPNYGYIFSTSNCVYTGMELSRYEKMLEIWKREGRY